MSVAAAAAAAESESGGFCRGDFVMDPLARRESSYTVRAIHVELRGSQHSILIAKVINSSNFQF